jgi:hypothetical protein
LSKTPYIQVCDSIHQTGQCGKQILQLTAIVK